MFTYVKAKNFKSLKDIEFNLNKTKTKTNQFISIYGENGSGKTNIVELFKLLQQATMSRAIDIAMNKMPKEFWKIVTIIWPKRPIKPPTKKAITAFFHLFTFGVYSFTNF